jgi:hypothetical protein
MVNWFGTFKETKLGEHRFSTEPENGAFIASAIDLGFRFKQDGDSPNALFDLSVIKK